MSQAVLSRIEVPAAVGGRLIIAYSGGLDSSVLLHLLASQSGARCVLAAHVHHGLQPQADAWAEAAAAECKRLGVALECLRVQVDRQGASGPEAAARAARYQALRGLMRPGDALVTAHQRDDQAETVLLRLLRGSGVDGLAAMRSLRIFEPGWLWRPLLGQTREDLHAYARAHGLRWIEDPHNADPRFARSWLRQELMPRLARHFGQARESLAHTAALAADTADLLAEIAEEDLRSLRRGTALYAKGLAGLSVNRRRNVLRHWLRGLGQAAPGAHALQRIERDMLAAAADAEPLLSWPGCELRRYRGLLYAMAPLPPPPAGEVFTWAGAVLELPAGCGQLRLPAAPAQALRVRFPSGGERFVPRGKLHRRTLKNLFQEAAVPPWVRRRTPLIEQEGELAYVAGLGPGVGWNGGAVQWLRAPPGAAAD